MQAVYVIIGFFMTIVGVCAGAITALIIRAMNRRSAAKEGRSYTEKDREQFRIDQETLLQGRREHSSEAFQ